MEGSHDTVRPETFVLHDGRAMLIRRVRVGDEAALIAFAERLSPRTIRLRFFTSVPRAKLATSPVTAFVRQLANVDFVEQAAYVAAFPGEDEIRAVGRYHRDSATSAEVAFLVEDDLQGMGLGTELLHHLAVHARTVGITTFRAYVLIENREMLDMLRASGYPMTAVIEGNVERVTLSIC
ncbi:MAG: GNAT family N-acetyltransferase [Chloroflexi bacterium]|nr:GNAT family N-acetyltransferase [Chloroflexota bacterium]